LGGPGEKQKRFLNINRPSSFRPEPQPTAERDDLGPEEWCFTPKRVPKSDIVACLIYEYGRELARLPRLRSKVTGKADAAKVDFREIMRHYLPTFRRISGRRFPGTAWQKLDQKIRSKLVKAVQDQVRNPRSSLRERVITDLREYQIVSLRDVNESFEEYFLRMNRKSSAKRRWTRVTDIPPGRGAARDVLHWLGALRVKVAYRTRDLVDHTKKMVKVAAHYSASTDLYAHAREAANILALLSVVLR
jgi:hypothetical protein